MLVFEKTLEAEVDLYEKKVGWDSEEKPRPN
jgi:hypothetical protein